MHESSLARQILRAVIDRASADGATRIRTVRGWIADTEALSRDSLAMHFTALARGTAAEGAALDLRIEHVFALCACGHRYAPDHHVLLCPTCGGTSAKLLGRTGLGIESLEVG